METPLVSVICLCYNHERFVEEALTSVLNQTYKNVELIVVDDASTDGSVQAIERVLHNRPEIPFIRLEKNKGNCAAFNIGFRKSKGQFIIDLAADDVLMQDRIQLGVKGFLEKNHIYGVQFSDSILIDESGKEIGVHSDKFPHHTIPQGDIYKELIRKYFILSPTMMIRREVLAALNGYDENLAYEDFDFLIRASRHHHFFYLPKQLVRRRIVSNSMNSRQFKRKSDQLQSTFEVCKKIRRLNKTEEENSALRYRIVYELKVALRLLDIPLALRYVALWWSVIRK